jgi:hypothetical protein
MKNGMQNNLFDSVINSIKSAWNLAIHPSTAKPMTIEEGVKFYYSFALLPGIAAIIIGYAAVGPIGAISAFAAVFILEMIGLFFGAGIYHLFGKFIFRKFTKDYSVTFTAAVVASIPTILFSWLSILIGPAGFIFGIWGIVLLTIGLMRMQKVSVVIAVLSWLIPVVILIILTVAILTAISAAIGTPGANLTAGALTTI